MDNEIEKIVEIIEIALARSDYKIIDGYDGDIIIRNADNTRDFSISVKETDNEL